MNIDPQLVHDAATDLTRIRETISEAADQARAATTTILPAGADEVSEMLSELFSSHAAQFQELVSQASNFNLQFAENMSDSAKAYETTETTNTIVLGATGVPEWSQSQLSTIEQAFSLNVSAAQVYTPEQIAPLYGSMSLIKSIEQGTNDLGVALQSVQGSTTVVGISQGASVATGEIRVLMGEGIHNQSLHFILAGDPNNPDGGLFERFPSLFGPIGGATPPNSPFPTAIFTNQYDPISDFPQHPLNLVSDLNSLLGITQHDYNFPTGGYVQLATSPDYHGLTTYYEMLDPTLPLVAPLRWFGGGPLADLLQPDLRVISDMGYGSGYANIPTPASLFGMPNWPVVAHDLLIGTQQGVNAFGVDVGVLPETDFPDAYPYLPTLYPNVSL